MPAEGGEATRVLPRSTLTGLAIRPGGIYVAGGRQPDGFPTDFLPFDGGKPRRLLTTPTSTFLIPEVSPDERWLLYTLADDPVREIILVDHFQ